MYQPPPFLGTLPLPIQTQANSDRTLSGISATLGGMRHLILSLVSTIITVSICFHLRVQRW
jgi:hypothetical protein